jgi:cholinesterase
LADLSFSSMNTQLILRRGIRVVACGLIAVATSGAAFAASFSSLYAFGDSLSDLGNTYNVLLTLYGSDQAVYSNFGYTAAPGRYDNGRWSNGPVWVENLNNSLGLPPLTRNNGLTSLGDGNNFAFGGSTSSTGYTNFLLPNLQTQISNYLGLASGSGSATSLYSVWSGGNDVIYYISGSNPNNPTAIQQQATTMAANIGTSITTLYNAGARSFIVANLPALGDKPNFINTPNQAFANAIVDAYNPTLAGVLAGLESQHNDITIYAWDVHSDFNQILQNPGSFGFTNTGTASFTYLGEPYPGAVVANPSEYVFWDDTHPTAPGHALLGAKAFALVPEPSSLVLVSIALAVPFLRKRR